MEDQKKSIEEYVKEQISLHRDEIIKKGVEGVKEKIEYNFSWAVSEKIKELIEKTFEEGNDEINEAFDNVKKEFIENIISEIAKVMPKIATEIAMGIQEKAIKTLTTDSYNRDAIFKKIFE